MLRRELRWRHPPAAAVRPNLVVVDPPARALDARLLQALKPMLVQALVAELAVEALDVGVLRGLPGLVEDMRTLLANAHAMKARLVNSGPWSVLTACGYRRRAPS